MSERLQTRTERKPNGETIVSEWAPTGDEEQPWRPVGAVALDYKGRTTRTIKPEELKV